MTKTAVMGGGALGMLLAAKLAAAGFPVSLWTRTQEQADRINTHGLLLENGANGPQLVIRVMAVPFARSSEGFDGSVWMALKQTALTETLLGELAEKLAGDAAVILFQNGAGHAEKIAAALPGRTVIAAVTTEGALRTGLVSVRHTGFGETWLGGWRDDQLTPEPGSRLTEIGDMLKQAGFSVFVSKQIRERMLRKLLVNAVINPLTALWRVPNGELTATSERRTAMEGLFTETLGILQKHGLQAANGAELWEMVLEVCNATAANRSSMLQDVMAGRETEIDALNGAVCRLAESSGQEAPWNAAMTALVKAILSPKERGV